MQKFSPSIAPFYLLNTTERQRDEYLNSIQPISIHSLLCVWQGPGIQMKKKNKTPALYLKSLKYCGGRRHRNQQLEHRCTIPYGKLWGEFGIEILWPLEGQCD